MISDTKDLYNFKLRPQGALAIGIKTLFSIIDLAVPDISFEKFEIARNKLDYYLHGCRYASTVEVHRIIPEEKFVGYKFTERYRYFFRSNNILNKDTLVKTFNDVNCLWDEFKAQNINGVIDLSRNSKINTLEITDYFYEKSLAFLQYIESEITEILNDSNIIIIRAWVDTQRIENKNLIAEKEWSDYIIHWTDSTSTGTLNTKLTTNDFVSTYVKSTKFSNSVVNVDDLIYNKTGSFGNEKYYDNFNYLKEKDVDEVKNFEIPPPNPNLTSKSFRSFFSTLHSQMSNMRTLPKYKFESDNFRLNGDNKVISNPIIVNNNTTYVIDDLDAFLFKQNDISAMFTFDISKEFRFTTKDNSGIFYIHPYFDIKHDTTAFRTSDWKFDLKLSIPIFSNKTDTQTPQVRIFANEGDLVDPPLLEDQEFVSTRMNILSDMSTNFTRMEQAQDFTHVEENVCKIYNVEKLSIGTMVRFISCKVFDKPVTFDFIRTKLLSSMVFINLEEGDNYGSLRGAFSLKNPLARGKLITSDSYCLSSFYKYLTRYTNIKGGDDVYAQLTDTEDDYVIAMKKIGTFEWDWSFLSKLGRGDVESATVYLPFNDEKVVFSNIDILNGHVKKIYIEDPNIGGKEMYVTLKYTSTNQEKQIINYGCIITEKINIDSQAIMDFINTKLPKKKSGIIAGAVVAAFVFALSFIIACFIYRKCYRNTVISEPQAEKKKYTEMANSSIVNNMSLTIDPKAIKIEL